MARWTQKLFIDKLFVPYKFTDYSTKALTAVTDRISCIAKWTMDIRKNVELDTEPFPAIIDISFVNKQNIGPSIVPRRQYPYTLQPQYFTRCPTKKQMIKQTNTLRKPQMVSNFFTAQKNDLVFACSGIESFSLSSGSEQNTFCNFMTPPKPSKTTDFN